MHIAITHAFSLYNLFHKYIKMYSAIEPESFSSKALVQWTLHCCFWRLLLVVEILVKQFLRRNYSSTEKKLIKPTPTRVFWCFSKHQPDLFNQLQQIDQDIELMEEIPSDNNATMFNLKTRSIFVIDDIMDETGLKVTKLFNKGRPHNVFVMFLTQNLFHKN